MLRKILFIATCACITFSVFSQIPNAGFENWTQTGNYYDPNGWGTINSATAILGVYTCERGTGADAHSGTYGIKLTAKNAIIQNAPGIAVTGTINTSTQALSGGFVYTQRPLSLTGWHKYAPASGDFAEIRINLWRRNGGVRVEVGSGSIFPNTAITSFTSFAVPINYTDPNNPDSAMILLLSSNPANIHVGSSLIVDDLAFTLCNGLNVSVTTIDVTTAGGNDGSATANVSGGTAPYTYSWSNGDVGATISNLSSGSYCVTVTDISGCSVSTCATVNEPVPPSQFSFIHNGVTRTYRVHTPPNFNPITSLPLVLNLHGRGSNGQQQEVYTGFDIVADTANFVIAYPDAITYQGDIQWNSFDLNGSPDDIGFLSVLIDTMKQRYNIDLSRVYCTGLSSGGYMSYRLGCSLSCKVAAIAPVAGLLVENVLIPCNPSRAVPVLHIHGTDDATVGYSGVAASISSWVTKDGCPASPTIVNLPDVNASDNSTVTINYYEPCNSGTKVILYTINNGGHTWPDAFVDLPGLVTNHDFNANSTIWNFFKGFTLQISGTPCDVCNDGDPCTDDSGTAGNCVHTPMNCDDSDPCTVDACVGGICQNTPGGCNVSISGSVATEQGTPIPTATVNLTGSSASSDVTAIDGLYQFDVATGGNYTVTPSKSNDVIVNNGITTQDILIIRRHILGTQSLATPYKIIAADVNGNGSVTTQDILLIRAIVLAVNTSFPGGRLWAFANSDFVFGNPTNPFPYDNFRSYTNVTTDQPNQNFIGMKLGDVNNNWDPLVAKAAAVGDVRLTMDEYHALPGNEFTVPVKARDFRNVTGYQFTLSWNPQVLTLLDVSNKALNGYYGMSGINEGQLTTSWYNDDTKALTLNDEETLFELKFKAIGTSGTQSAIKIGSELAVSEAYNENLDLMNVVATNGVVKVGEASSSSVVSHQTSDVSLAIQPNPFTNSTNIIFSLPQDEMVTLSIYDILGREVKRVEAAYQAGEHHIEWSGDDTRGDALSKGLYHVRMIAGGNALSRKVVMMR